MLVTIVNHEHNEQAIKLANGMRPYADLLTIDSGSNLDARSTSLFDIKLPNVYYSGLINVACDELEKRAQHTVIYFICSDIDFADHAKAIASAQEAFRNPQVGVYAPAMNVSGHPQMRCRHSNGLRPVVFVEGVAFAVRASLFRNLCPIDTQVNALGWGLDVYLGFLAMQAGLDSVVDDRILVVHEATCGYDRTQARRQRERWFAGKSPAARRFQRLTSFEPLKSNMGLRMLKRISWA